MKSILNCTCSEEKIFSSHKISDDGKKILVDKKSKSTVYQPFDDAISLVVDYLNIGFLSSNGADVKDAVHTFVSRYGMPERDSYTLDISEFSENAEALYMHFCEISQTPYPDTPEWIIETEPASAVISKKGSAPYIQWQTENLSNAVELAYSVLLCSDAKQLGLCKHCLKPFYSKNPKSEFCSSSCRNRYNVYKSRSKNKK